VQAEAWLLAHPEMIAEAREKAARLDNVQNLSQCAGRPAMSSRCKSDTMKE
jgi:hypothetical protein